MSLSLLGSMVLRVSVVLGISLSVAALLGRHSAVTRRLVVLLGLAAALALALVSLALPERPMAHVVPAPEAARVVAEALSVASPSALPSPSAHAAPLSAFASGETLVISLWLLGVSLALLRLGYGMARVWGLIRRADVFCAGLAFSREIESPLVAGWVRPLILLPLSARGWSAERERLVLAHERAHVRRRDGLALLVGQLVGALFWFHPLAWVALSRLRRECELAADEDAIATGARATDYAEHLLSIARGLTVRFDAIAMAGRPSELSRRIEVLVSRARLPAVPSRKQSLLICLGSALVLLVVACADAVEPPRSPAARPEVVRGTDAGVQALVEREAERARSEWHASRVAIVVLRPDNGAVLALADDGAGRAIRPASALKPLTVALALDSGRVTASQRFDCGDGKRAYGTDELHDATPYGLLDVGEILAVSSNVGVSRVFDALGARGFREGLPHFGIEVPAEVEDGTIQGATAAIGHRVQTTPLALARAYAALANDGVYVPAESRTSERVVASKTAATLRQLLEGAVSGERATGKAAQIPGVRVAGKTGTSDYDRVLASFAGFLPADAPRFVIYVGVEVADPSASGGAIAAPLFARIGRQLLAR